MKRGKFFWQLVLVFVVALVGYAAVFGWIEHRRVVKGPWVVTFTGKNETPAIILNQGALGIREVRVLFQDATTQSNRAQTREFSRARLVPFEVPFGQCVFQDTTFLPGTVAFEMFGHQIQLMPRVLTIDKTERPWRSGETIELGKLPATTQSPSH